MLRRGVALAVALALSACGADDDDGDGGARPPAPPTLVEVPWLRAQSAGGGELLRLGYVNDPCTRARRAEVEYADRTVTVTLLDPERDPERVCVALAKPGCAEVRLAEPLDGRRVVDGARGRPPRGGDDTGGAFSRFEPCRPVPVAD